MITIYISKADKTLPIDWDSMPENAQRHIIEYGLRQKLNDAGSSATTKELGEVQAGEQALAMAENVLSALMAGNVHVRRAASQMTLEERCFLKVLKALFKKAVGKPEDKTKEELITGLANKFGKGEEAIILALEAKAKDMAEVERKVAALKQDLPSIDI